MDYGILINQSKYVDDLLFKLDLHSLKHAPSLCVVEKQLSIFYGYLIIIRLHIEARLGPSNTLLIHARLLPILSTI